jgi:hypothetical protein
MFLSYASEDKSLVEFVASWVYRGDSGTAGTLLTKPALPSETKISGLLAATDEAASKRRNADVDLRRAGMVHRSRYLDQWHMRAKKWAEKPASEMLQSLYTSGFSWRDIARLLEVSVPAVQKWRNGSKVTTKNLTRLRDFMAGYDMVAAHLIEVDVASWLDVPLMSDVPITPLDLWSFTNPVLFFEYALASDVRPEAILDEYDPDWRAKYRDDGFETFIGTDGRMGIRTKDR